MKKLSDRGCATVAFIIVVIICIAAIIVINNAQEVQSQQWQKELRIEVKSEWKK